MGKPIRVSAATIEPLSLKEAMGRYEKWQVAQSYSPNTMKGIKSNLSRLITAAGANTMVHNITPEHVAIYMTNWADKGQGTKNNALGRLRAFFKWARDQRHASPWEHDDVTRGWKSRQYEVKQGDHIPSAQWPRVLEIAGRKHPVHRAIIATGLYLMQRGPSEQRVMTLADLNLSQWKARVVRPKTHREADWIPVCGELRLELTQWLSFYNRECMRMHERELRRTDALFPRTWYVREGEFFIDPTSVRSEKSVQNLAGWVLEEFGRPVWHADGSKNRAYSSHFWRRCGARALFDELLETSGYDGALAVVREMLGHKSNQTTERYLNLSLDRTRRDQAVTQNNGFMFAHNDPSQARPSQLTTAQLPASLAGGVTLGGAAVAALEDAEAVVLELPSFFRQAAA